MGATALIWLLLRNERTDGVAIRIDSVLASEGAFGNMVWEGTGDALGGAQSFPVMIQGTLYLRACVYIYTYSYTTRVCIVWQGTGDSLGSAQSFPVMIQGTAIPIIIEGRETAFNGFQY